MERTQANPIVHYIYFLYFYERIKESHSLCRQDYFCEYNFTPAEISYCLFKLYLFYNNYETSYTTYINHARWHQCVRLDGLRVGGNRSTRRKPTCLTW